MKVNIYKLNEMTTDEKKKLFKRAETDISSYMDIAKKYSSNNKRFFFE